MEEEALLMLAAAPGVVALLWQAFKAYATLTPAKWDEDLVTFIENTAKEAAKK